MRRAFGECRNATVRGTLLAFFALTAVPTAGKAQIQIDAITNGASFTASYVAPGSVAALFGRNLATDTAQAGSVPLPSSLANTSVLIDGAVAPLWYVSPTQINFQMPYRSSVATVQVVVKVGSNSSDPLSLQLSRAAPGIFLYGTARAFAQNLADNFSLNDPGHPAAAGSYISLYMTGQGPVDNPVPDGIVTPSAPLSNAMLPYSATIGGHDASVRFLGLTPGNIGLLQANLLVPDLPPGDYPVIVTIGGAVSNAGLLAVTGASAGPDHPMISASRGIIPTTATAGGAGFQLTVNGTNFEPGAVIRWTFDSSTQDLQTDFVSSSRLTAAVPPSLIASAGFVLVTVRNPVGDTSNAVPFVVNGEGGQVGAAPPAITPQFFGLHVTSAVYQGTLPWPTAPFGAMRLWDTATRWSQINPSQGVYDFSTLDQILAKMTAENVRDSILTFGGVPRWISSNPSDPNCAYSQIDGPGTCDPPGDLKPDGTGTDQAWKDFIAALARHLNGRIKYFELWNEPTDPRQWNGTIAQLARMARDAGPILKVVDPQAKLTTGTPVTNASFTLKDWMTQFLAAAGASAVDIISFHSYVGQQNQPETVLTFIAGLKQAAASNGGSSLPIWDTEASWGKDTNLPDPDLQAAYLARYYLLQAGGGIARFYWYRWDSPDWGTLWDPASGIHKAGIAYGQVYNWLAGSAMTAPCTASGTVWTCALTRGNSYRALAVWDASGTCSNGTCTTFNYMPDPLYVSYRALDGASTPIAPGTPIKIGAKPILLEHQ